jgi:putative phage-type endonuclease
MLTPEELRERANFIGSSDVPALLGFSRWRTPKEVWLEKTRRAIPEPSTSDPAEFGTAVEPVLVEWCAHKVGHPATRGRIAHHPEHPFMRAQLDGWIEARQAVVEAKAYGLFNPRWSGVEWGLDGSDMVPRDVMAQVNFQMACSVAEAGFVTALLGNGMGVRVYYLPRNGELVAAIEEACDEFWNDHVLADVPPETPVGMETFKAIAREPGSWVEIDHDWPDRWSALKDQEKIVAIAVDEAKRGILDEMGEAEKGVTPFGSFSFRADARGRHRFLFHGPEGNALEDEP